MEEGGRGREQEGVTMQGRSERGHVALKMEEGSHKSRAVGYPEGGKGRMGGPALTASTFDTALPTPGF